MVDPHGRIAVLNHRAAELLDIPERFVPGERLAALVDWQRREGEFKHGTPPVVLSQLIAMHPDLTVHRCYKRTRPNGTVLEVRTHMLPDGSAVRTYSDVTATEQTRAPLTTARDATVAAAPPVLPPPVLPPDDNTIAVEPTTRQPLPADHLAVEHLTDTLGGDAVAGIVATLLDGLPRQLDRMRDLARTGDTDPLLREAHALAGSAATIGLDELGAAASELEQDLKSQRLAATAARLDRIDRLARSGVDRLAAYLHKRAA